MEKIQLYKSLNSLEERECIEKFLIYNASLVISGAKPSATITLKKNTDNIFNKWMKYGREFLKAIDLDYIELREGENSLIILVYNRVFLSNHIFKEENKRFLMKIGYEAKEDINRYIEKLKERYDKYKCPHELGVFLGFPIDDVKDFMECSDKRCLRCGYWLVYNDVEKAKMVFNHYDEIKAFTAKSILEGNPSHKVAYNIKKNFRELSI